MSKRITIKSLAITSAVAAVLVSGGVFAKGNLTLSDTNGDGVISAEEITAARAASKADMLAQFDTDGNGELSRTERRAMRDARYDAMLLEFDADGDGELSRDEKRAAKEARRASVQTMLDVNGDGEVSAEESAGWEQVKEERGDKGGKRGKGRHGKSES